MQVMEEVAKGKLQLGKVRAERASSPLVEVETEGFDFGEEFEEEQPTMME